MQGRFKRGSGAAGQAESPEPLAAPHQSEPDAVPGDRLVNGEPEGPENDAGPDEQDEAGRLSRARLRGTLNRRRATGFGRVRMRNWRIRTRLSALLLLPVVVALVLGGLRINTSLQSSQQLAQMANLSDLAVKATQLADALETERDISAGPLTKDPTVQDDRVTNARRTTDDLTKAYNARADSFDNLDLAGGNSLLMQVRKDMTLLSNFRNNAYTQVNNIEATVASYDTIIKDLLSISQEIALGSDSPDLVKSTRALEQFSLEKESTSMQRALISAALARPGGADMSTSDQSFGFRLITADQSAAANFNSIYGTTAAQKLRERLTYNTEINQADRYAGQVLQANGIKQADFRTYQDWYDQATVKIDAERAIENQLLEELKGKAQSLQSAADNDVILNGVLIALVLLVAVGGAALMARSLTRSLTRLQTSAEDVAERRLPELVKTLSENDPHEVDLTVDPVGIDSADEIGHVAHAFDMVHNEAVRLAAEQALLRGNINSMFTNLSRRSQGLIQRQLSLISELESREADPDQLASLFKLDHLATRMRRNGENLLVLAGEDPGRRWTRPVPLVDVLRAAASEVEQYERIELASVPSTEVAGRVVNDLVHLLAELLENATSFSSPQTRVRVTGHALPDGRVLIEIHDTGIGLSPDDLAEINERLANPPTVDVSVSRRMGLFVVGRLSLRHGIRIQLRPSDSGGTTALVMLPVDVTNAGDRRAPRPNGPGQRGAGPTPRQQRAPLPGGEAPGLPQRPAPALGQGPSGPGAPAGRPQLSKGPSGPAAPAQPSTGGLPTRAVGQSLRETPPTGRPQQPQPPQQPQQGRRPAAPAGPPAPGGPGLPRRGAGQPAPAGAPGPQGHERPAEPNRPAQPNRPEERGQVRRGPRTDVGPAGRPAGLPQRPGVPNAAAAQQHGQLPQGEDLQGPPTLQQPVLGSGGFAERSAAPAPVPAPAPAPAPVETTASFARPRFEASDIDPRDPLGLGLVEPVLPSVGSPTVGAPRAGEARGPQAPFQPAEPQQQFAPRPPAPQGQPGQPGQHGQPAQGQPAQGQPALPPRRTPEHGQGEDQAFRSGGASRMASVQVNQDRSQQQGRRSYQPQRPGTTAPGHPVPADQPVAGRPTERQSMPGQPMPGQPAPGESGQAPQRGPGEAPWRSSANDERWRRAEQLRQPTSDGVTLSGLPRRTPQANLVAGTAEAAPLSGPQVSRAPEEVRGRLTNLRRGIQQGRRAGAGDTQQFPAMERPFDGFGNPAGAEEAQGGYRSPAPGADGPGPDGGYGFGTQNQER
ncbi:sensor histidine kinase [Kitasatospora viridis]|uniref:histidine kinase n=1 Tax=Kitasatospora viridis TaxID=281105 RepID=A0A561UEJ6_9ACTN|nr:nitrate- and nitrite sensing domain-containing protein [Kitasatospora viridis]TWF97781.1 signal transduction histidine kinase [Kitasatospora viridis]